MASRPNKRQRKARAERLRRELSEREARATVADTLGNRRDLVGFRMSHDKWAHATPNTRPDVVGWNTHDNGTRSF